MEIKRFFLGLIFLLLAFLSSWTTIRWLKHRKNINADRGFTMLEKIGDILLIILLT
jgi:hypothetical protein